MLTALFISLYLDTTFCYVKYKKTLRIENKDAGMDTS